MSASRSKPAGNVVGANGVAIPQQKTGAAQYRTYEVYQRERVGQSTAKIKPAQLLSDAFLRDPYPLLAVLRENYPCYRDWLSNCYWITRYDDVTSVFADDANFETRPRRWFYGLDDYGRDLGGELPVLTAHAAALDAQAESIARRAAGDIASRGSADLATEFAARFVLEMTVAALNIPVEKVEAFVRLYVALKRGSGWHPTAARDGRAAMDELTHLLEPLVSERRRAPGEDVISAMAGLAPDGGAVGARDVVVTLLEADHETLHGTLANLFFALLTHPDQLAELRDHPLNLKIAILETLRWATPTLAALRFARHEVERFGRLLPEGALVVCSAAAANRDPRVFANPDAFIATRRDICHREARGQYRADGLATGIAFGTGAPTRHPAVPEDRPRSAFALTRDTALTAAGVLLDSITDLKLAESARPELRSLRLGEMHTCWQLPVTFSAA